MLHGAEIFDVNVSAQAGIIGEIPTRMVGIIIDGYRVGIPEPVADIAIVERRDTERDAVKPEAFPISAGEAKLVAKAESEAAVPPGVLDVEARVVPAEIVANPAAVAIDMRGIGMAVKIAKVVSMLDALWSSVMCGRTVRRNIASSNATVLATLALIVMLLSIGIRQNG